MLAYIAIGWLSSLVYFVFLRRENAKRETGERDEVIRGVDGVDSKCVNDERNGVYESVEEAKREKGDERSGFRYTL